MNNQKNVNVKRLIIVSIILVVFIGIIAALYYGTGLHKQLQDIEALKETINSYENRNISRLIYVMINFLLTTIIPITNIPTILAGAVVFDRFLAANLANIGVLLGSIVSFFVGRHLGRKTVAWIVGEDNLVKYLDLAKGRENLVIFLILLLPGFPDDIICMIAGLTKMKWRFFIITILITRTIPTYIIVYLFDFVQEKFNTFWGIIILSLMYIIVFIVGRYVLKYWDSIVNFFSKFKIKKKEDIN